MGTIAKAMSNSFYLILDWMTQTFLGYLFWVALAKLLSAEYVGKFSTILNLALFISGFSILGLHVASTKLLSEYQAKNKIKKIKSTVFYTLKISFAVNLIILFFIFTLSQFFSQFGYLSEIQTKGVGVVSFSIYLLYLSGLYLYSLQKMKKLFVINTEFALSKLIITVILIFLGFNYFGAVAGVVVSALVFSVLRLKNIPIKITELLSHSNKTKPDKKRIWFYAIPSFIGGIGIILIQQGNIIALSIFNSMVSVGIFTIAFTFSTIIRFIPQTIANALLPITSQQWTLKEKSTLNKTIMQALKYSYLFSIPITFAFIMFAREFLLIFASPEYLQGVIPLQILSVAYLFFGLSSVPIGVLYYTGKPDTNRNINLASGFANILFCILLIPFFGIFGASLAFLFSCFMMFSTSFYYSYRHLRFSLATDSLVKNIFASFLFILTIYFFRQFDASIFTIAVAMTSASLLYIISLLNMKFFDEIDLKILKESEAKSPPQIKKLIRCAENVLKRFIT